MTLWASIAIYCGLAVLGLGGICLAIVLWAGGDEDDFDPHTKWDSKQ